jgi:predicted alpha/beta superfamily hydrolase
MYVTDGNWYFAPASINATESSGEIDRVIVVGIGYPTDDNDAISKRRAFELTPWSPPTAEAGQFGGGDTFLRVIEEEIKPFVNAHYAVDTSRQIFFGKSYGGLIVLRQLFRNPAAYATYIIASPAIGFNDRAILKDEASFAERVRGGGLNLRILITAAGNEQYRGTDPVLLARSNLYRMVDNAMELADRLAALRPQKVHVEKAIIPDESHVSVSLASVGRALYFALKH